MLTTLKSSLSNLIEFTVQVRTESRSIDRFDDSAARDFAFAIAMLHHKFRGIMFRPPAIKSVLNGVFLTFNQLFPFPNVVLLTPYSRSERLHVLALSRKMLRLITERHRYDTTRLVASIVLYARLYEV